MLFRIPLSGREEIKAIGDNNTKSPAEFQASDAAESAPKIAGGLVNSRQISPPLASFSLEIGLFNVLFWLISSMIMGRYLVVYILIKLNAEAKIATEFGHSGKFSRIC